MCSGQKLSGASFSKKEELHASTPMHGPFSDIINNGINSLNIWIDLAQPALAQSALCNNVVCVYNSHLNVRMLWHTYLHHGGAR